MGGPWEDYASPQNVAGLVAAEASRQGVDPELAVRVAKQESGFNHAARSPKGAVGVMQLMPDTAKGLGVDPNDLHDNIRGGVTYLKQQSDRFGSPRLAAAAYNAGPGAVAAHGGVPPFKETQDYVDAVAPQGAAENPPWMDYGAQPSAPAAQPEAAPASAPTVLRSHNGGVTVQIEPKGPTVAQDAWSGATQPFRNLGHDVMDEYRRSQAKLSAPLPTSLSDIGSRLAEDLGFGPKLVGDVAGLAAAPSQAVVRPLARAAAKVLPTPYSRPKLTMQGGKVVIAGPQPLSGDDAQAATEGMINTSLSGAKPAMAQGLPGAYPTKPPPAMSLDELKAAKDAAYSAVDASGFKFPQADVQKLAESVAAEVARKGGPSGARLYPASTAVSDRLTALAQQPDGVPLTQLDELRSDIYGALVKPGDREAPIGAMMRQQIDRLINESDAPHIQEARDLNTRYMKTQAITDKLDSAGLRSASTYSGGNFNNAVRQNLRPLVDPTSAQHIGNLTPDEAAALRRAVTGTPGQNATRYVSKLLTNKIVQAPAAVMTHGMAAAPMEAVGTVLNKVGESQTQAAVQRVLDLISRGGRAATEEPPIGPLSYGPHAGSNLLPPITAGRGLIGGTALLGPVVQTAAERERARATTKRRASSPGR